MWLSASAFFHQFFRVYSPVAFPRNYDKDGKFVKHFLPILKKFPPKYIYEPWKAPLEMQKRAGCLIGKDYPKPIVDHHQVHKININRMKAAYKKKLYGDSVKEPPASSPLTVQTGSIQKANFHNQKRKVSDDVLNTSLKKTKTWFTETKTKN